MKPWRLPSNFLETMKQRLDHTRPETVLHQVQVDINKSLCVVGDIRNGCYDWVLINHSDAIEKFSNRGYGDDAVALRNGLCAQLGNPPSWETERMTMPTETLYPAAKVRATFNISGMTLWRWVHKGILPAPIVINGRNFWPDSAVQAVIANGRGAKG